MNMKITVAIIGCVGIALAMLFTQHSKSVNNTALTSTSAVTLPVTEPDLRVNVVNNNKTILGIISESAHQYDTVFFDDFDGPIDRDTWTFHTQPPVSGGPYNSRFKTNNSNVYTEDGCLIMDCSKTATVEDGTYPNHNGEEVPVNYISPYISTCNKLAISEGRISVRLRMSKDIKDGMFPGGFWTFGQGADWPFAHEMDVIESTASILGHDTTARDGTMLYAGSHCSNLANRLHYSTGYDERHWPINIKIEKWQKINYAIYHDGVHVGSKDFIDNIDFSEWHVYTAEWTKDYITYYIDGKIVYSATAEQLGAVDETGTVGFMHPQDIRFNIKAVETTTDDHGYLLVDWVRAESLYNAPCNVISHEDVLLSIGGSKYINPTFNEGCSNKAFSLNIEDDGVLAYQKYLNDASQMVVHKIIGKKPGVTTVTLRAANDKAVSSFKVTVE